MKILRNTLIAIALIMGACESDSLDYSADMSPESGTGGSLARFTISGNYLYTVDASSLKTFDITNENKPQLIGEQDLNWGVETIFALNDLLFLGTRTGIYIFDISDPDWSGLSNWCRRENRGDFYAKVAKGQQKWNILRIFHQTV